MRTQYSELILTAPHILVKGFLLGFIQGSGKDIPFFFHKKFDIKRETIGEMVREILDLDCHTHVCIPSEFVSGIQTALEKTESLATVKIESNRVIKHAEFTFSFHLYNESQSQLCKQLFENLPEGLKLSDFHPVESKNDVALGVKEYAPLHPYIYHGDGLASGPFNSIMTFYVDVKKSKISEFIHCSKIKLNF